MQRLFRAAALLFFALVLVAPLYAWLSSLQGAPGLRDYFQLLGLYAFSLAFIAIFLSVFSQPLSKVFPKPKALRAHMAIGILSLLLAVSHPIALSAMLAARSGFQAIASVFFLPSTLGSLGPLAGLGAIALYLLAIGAIAGIARRKMRYSTFLRIHSINYVAFFFAFFHSFLIGTHLKGTVLSWLWPAYLAIVLVGIALKLKSLFWKGSPQPSRVPEARESE